MLRLLALLSILISTNVGAQDVPAIHVELGSIQARLDELRTERKKYRVGPPIAMTAAGGGALLLGATFSLFWTVGIDEWQMDHAWLPLTIGGAVGVSLIVPAVVLFSRRGPPRRLLGNEIRSLRLRQRELEWQLRTMPQAYGLMIGARF